MEVVDEENRITLWVVPEDYIESSYGKITYREWCERERKRISAQGSTACVVAREDGMIALFR